MMMNPAFLLLCFLSAGDAFAPTPSVRTARLQPLTRGVIMPLPKKPAVFLDKAPTLRRKSSALRVSLSEDPQQEREQIESWEADSKLVELALLLAWAASISGFILMNNFVGPWPEAMKQVPERVWFVLHMLGGMLFGGGVILTTAIEWLVANNKNSPVLLFWFDKVPLLDAAIVLPALTMAMISGTGLSIAHYGGLGIAPLHISIVFYALVAFATWWAVTDLTTQGKALTAVNEWAVTTSGLNSENHKKDVPEVVEHRRISNIVSCLFILALYGIMVFKPGTLHSMG